MSYLNKAVLFYDGKCNFCITIIKILKGIDLSGKFTFLDLWKDSPLKKYGLIQSDLKDQIHLLDKNGEIFKGYFAIREVFRKIPLLLPLSLVTYLPFSSYFGQKIYQFVAKHRHNLSSCSEDCQDNLV